MAIELEKEFAVAVRREEAWAFLISPERVVPCLPGARLLREIDERTYEGEIGLRLGPIGAAFEGTIWLEDVDPERFRVNMLGRGSERRGRGVIRMSLRSELLPRDGGGTLVRVSQVLSLEGRLARFGGGRVLRGVAELLFGRFVSCVQRTLGEPD